jgi:hypothetical protein
MAGFAFEGGSYPQDFVLGDVEADGPLEPGAINSFAGGGGVAMFFPLGSPTTWRVIAMRAADRADRASSSDAQDSPVGPLTLVDLQAIVAPPSDASVTVRDPAWLTHFDSIIARLPITGAAGSSSRATQRIHSPWVRRE